MAKMTKKMEQLIEKNMNALKISYEEAKALVEDDMLIDKGGRCDWEPSVEEEKAMRKATKVVGDRKKPTTPVKRERKEDFTKQNLISILEKALGSAEDVADVEVTNKERVITFTVGDENFEVVLTKKRKSKK